MFDQYGQLCVGIDPHSYLLQAWGLPDTASSLSEFGLRVVDACIGQVGIVKPQVAFFERFGSAGYLALEQVLTVAREAGLMIIADVKRGDVGTSVEAYGQAWLTPGGPLEADAMTISAFQGVGSIRAPMQLAESTGKGLFVLAATSNPEASDLQTAMISRGIHSGDSVASSIVRSVGEWNSAQKLSATRTGSGGDYAPNAPGIEQTSRMNIGAIGVVIGATVDFARYGIDLESMATSPATSILAPGFGHQGARFSELASLYGPAAPSAVVSVSRSVLESGPGGIRESIRSHAGEVRSCRE